MDASFQGYLDLLRELSGRLEHLAGLEQQKADAVRQDDLIALDEVLKQEQAEALALRGLEQRRLKLASQLGLDGATLEDLPKKCPAELELEAGQTVDGLRRSFKIYRSFADMARNALELNLHQIEKIVAGAEAGSVNSGAGYKAPNVEPPKNMKTDFRA